MIHPIQAPMVNVNDDSALLSLWTKADKTHVQKGEVIAVLETTKATFDLEAEQTGYLRIVAAQGAQIAVGEIIGAISDTADEELVLAAPPAPAAAPDAASRKITKKAEIAALKAGLDLDRLRAAVPGDGAVTEADVADYLASAKSAPAAHGDTVDDVYPQNRRQRLLIIGGGMGAVQLLDSLSRIDHQRAVAILDDNVELNGRTVMGVPVLGGQDMAEALFAEKRFDAAIVSVGSNLSFRDKAFARLRQAGIPAANVIDPSARIGRNAVLGAGNLILAHCHIGACAVVGNNNVLSAYVDIEHHSVLGDSCTFGPGVMTSSCVRIGSRVRFGTGVFIEPKLSIGADSIVGSGAIITRDIPEGSIVKTKVNYTVRPRTLG